MHGKWLGSALRTGLATLALPLAAVSQALAADAGSRCRVVRLVAVRTSPPVRSSPQPDGQLPRMAPARIGGIVSA